MQFNEWLKLVIENDGLTADDVAVIYDLISPFESPGGDIYQYINAGPFLASIRNSLLALKAVLNKREASLDSPAKSFLDAIDTLLKTLSKVTFKLNNVKIEIEMEERTNVSSMVVALFQTTAVSSMTESQLTEWKLSQILAFLSCREHIIRKSRNANVKFLYSDRLSTRMKNQLTELARCKSKSGSSIEEHLRLESLYNLSAAFSFKVDFDRNFIQDNMNNVFSSWSAHKLNASNAKPPSKVIKSQFDSLSDEAIENVSLLTKPLEEHVRLPKVIAPLLPEDRTIKTVDAQRYRKQVEHALNLPYTSYWLSLRDRCEIMQQFEHDITGRANSKIALISMLCVFTSSTPQQVLSFKLCRDISYDAKTVSLSPYYGWTIRSLKFAKREGDNDSNDLSKKAILHSHSEYITLPLSDSLASALSALLEKYGEVSLSDVFDITPSELNDYLNNIKKLVGLGSLALSSKALRYILFATISANTDVDYASLVLATDEFANPISLYYLSAAVSDVQKVYLDAIQSLHVKARAVDSSSIEHIGSRLCIKQPSLVSLITDKNKVLSELVNREKHTTRSVIQLHNYFALYASMAMSILVGHRATREFFFDDLTLDFERGHCLVSDKFNDQYSAARLLPLPSLILSLFDNYRKQLRYVSWSLKEANPQLSALLYSRYLKRQNGQPFLALIEGNELRPISSADIIAFLGEHFKLRSNALRHFVSANLPLALMKERRLLLGHIDIGQHCLDGYSFNNVFSAFDSAKGKLDDFLYSLGLRALPGRYLKGKASMPSTAKDETQMYVPSKWLERESMRIRVGAFARRTVKAQEGLFFLTDDALTSAFDNFQCETLPSDWGRDACQLYANLLYGWKRYFIETSNIQHRKRRVSIDGQRNSMHLQVLSHARVIDKLQHYGIDVLNEHTYSLGAINTFMLSLLIYQPYSMKDTLLTSNSVEFRVFTLRSTLYLQSSAENASVFPLNVFSSYLFLECGLTSTIKVSQQALLGAFRSIKKLFSVHLSSSDLRYAFASLPALREFVSRNGLASTSRLAVTDSRSKNPACHYDMTNVARLFLPTSQTISITPEASLIDYAQYAWPPNQSNAKLIKYDASHLLLMVKKALRQKKPSQSNHAAILDVWQELIGLPSKSISKLVRASYSLSHLAIAMLLYALNVSVRASSLNRNKLVTPKTITDYLTTIHDLLASEVQNTYFLLAEEVVIERLYFDAVTASNKFDRHQVVERLRNFHISISKSLYLPGIDFLPIFKISKMQKGYKHRGIARLITPHLYDNVFNAIKRNAYLNEEEQLLHQSMLVLGYRAGLRPEDIALLQVRHLNIETWMLTIRGHQLAASKSTNTPRRVPLSWYLNEEEKAILERLYKRATRLGRAEPKAFLFAIEFSNNLSYDSITHCIVVIKSNLSLLLQSYGGDAKVRFYDCRHSFVNYHLLLLSEAYLDRRYHKTLKAWCRSDDLEDARAQLIYSLVAEQPHVGGTLIYAIAQRLGHSPITCREYYIHTLALLSEIDSNLGLHTALKSTTLLKKLRTDNLTSQFRFDEYVRSRISQRRNDAPINASDIASSYAEPQLQRLLDETVKLKMKLLDWHNKLHTHFEMVLHGKQPQLLESLSLSKYHAFVEATGSYYLYLPGASISKKYVEQFDRSFRYLESESTYALLNTIIMSCVHESDDFSKLMQFWLDFGKADTLQIKRHKLREAQAILTPLGLEVRHELKGKQFITLTVHQIGTRKKGINRKIAHILALLSPFLYS